MTTTKPIVQTRTAPPDSMHRDLGRKFSADVNSLVERAVAIMAPAIGIHATVDIVLSVLADAGLLVEECGGCRPRTFEAIVDAASAPPPKKAAK